MSSLLMRLRQSTTQAHADLEKQVDIEKVCEQKDTYTRLLADFLGFYEPLESHFSRFDGWNAIGVDLGERAKSEWLKSDLRVLGFSDEEIAALPRCESLPEAGEFDAAVGAAYVLEGATLGGRQITQWLEKTDIPTGARTFFASYGPKTGEKWKEFCAALERHEGNGDEVVRGANETFSTLAAWLTLEKAA
jgi:heme oxygenase